MNKKVDHFKLNDDIFLISDKGINLQEVEKFVQLLHFEDWEYAHSKEKCEYLLEQIRSKIGYSRL